MAGRPAKGRTSSHSDQRGARGGEHPVRGVEARLHQRRGGAHGQVVLHAGGEQHGQLQQPEQPFGEPFARSIPASSAKVRPCRASTAATTPSSLATR